MVNWFSNDRCAAQRQRRSAAPRLNGVAATREEARSAAGKWQGRGRPPERGTTVPIVGRTLDSELLLVRRVPGTCLLYLILGGGGGY